MSTTGPGRDDAEAAGERRDPREPRRGPSEVIVLAAQPGSVSAGRRFVRKVLEAAPAPLIDDAALVVTELVSNAVLHAGGPITLTTEVVPDAAIVRLEVADSSPVPPVLRDYGTVASTGRGLTLVARLAKRWGVESAEPGKRVWVELALDRLATDERGHLSLPSSTLAEAAPPDEESVPVRFDGVPVSVYLRLQEQNDAVLRELELLAFTADHAGQVDPSPELVALIERSRRYFNLTREGFRGVVAAAAERGESTVDLEGTAALSGLGPSADLVDLFEQAEELSRQGELLIGPADDDVTRLRRWFVEELTAQLIDRRLPQPFSP